MSRFVLVFPPLHVDASAARAACYANLGALELLAQLRAEGHEATLVDALAMPASDAVAQGDRWTLGAPADEVVRVALAQEGELVVVEAPGAVALASLEGSGRTVTRRASDGRAPPAWEAAHLDLWWRFLGRFEHAAGQAPGALFVSPGTLALRSSHASDESLRAAREAGGRTVVLFDDGTTGSDFEGAVARAQQAGLYVHVRFGIGGAGDLHAEVNAKLSRALALHDATGAWPTVEVVAGPGAPLAAAELEPFKWTFDRRVEAGQGPAKVIMNATYRCNNRCTFCATGTRTQFDGNLDRQKEILRKYRAHGVTLLDIDGGEPTLNPNLLELVGYAREIGYEKVNVTTNGRMASYEGFARRLVRCGVTSILFSIHGHTAQVHAQNVGVAEAFDQTLAGVRNVVKLAPPGVELGANVTITKSNHRVLPEMAQLVWDLGLRWWNLQFLTPFGRATRATCPDTQTAADIAMRVIDQWRDRLKFQVINLPFCFMPGYEEFLVGDLLKLERHMIFVNNDEVNLFEYLRERRTRKPVCDTCPRAIFCGGFYELDNVPEPTWLVTPEDLTRPVAAELPEVHVARIGLGAR